MWVYLMLKKEKRKGCSLFWCLRGHHLEREVVLQEVRIFIFFPFSFSFSSFLCNYFSFRMRMVVLDDDGTSSGDSSSTLMDSFSRRDKFRVLQIGGYLNEVGEDEIESEVGAIDRRGTALGPNVHGMR